MLPQKSILPLLDQKQMIANYKTLSPAEKVAVPAVSYLRSKKKFGTLEQDKATFPRKILHKPRISHQVSRTKVKKGAVTNYFSISQPLLIHNPMDFLKEGCIMGKKLCHSRPWPRYRDSKDGRLIFLSAGRNYKPNANIGLDYSCTHYLVTILVTGAGPNFILKAGFQQHSKPNCPLYQFQTF